jgi:hypothetical protein
MDYNSQCSKFTLEKDYEWKMACSCTAAIDKHRKCCAVL